MTATGEDLTASKTDADKELATVSVDIVSAEDLDDIKVLGRIDKDSPKIGLLSRVDTAFSLASDVFEAIPEKGLYKVITPEGYSLQDLAPAKGETGYFRAVVRSKETNKIAGQAKLKEVATINPTQIAGMGLSAAAMVVGQAYMTEISDSLHSIDEKMDKLVSMFADQQKAKLTNALNIAKDYSKLYEDYRQRPEALQAARNEIERCYNDVGEVVDWITLQLEGVGKKVHEAKANKKELQSLLEELHSHEEQFSMSLQALSALAMTRMYYDGATDERSALIEQKRIINKSQGFLKKRSSIAGELEIKIGALKGAPIALPRGEDKNPLKNLTSKTPVAAAKQNLLETKVGMQSDLRSAKSKIKAEAEDYKDSIKRVAKVSRSAHTVLTDGTDCWLIEEPSEGEASK